MGFFAQLRSRFQNRSAVSLFLRYLELGQVQGLLAAWETSPDLLKIDIDHADCLFMKEALRFVRPKLIHFEFLPQLPPPMDYAQMYQPRLLPVGLEHRASPSFQEEQGKSGREFAGCSLAAFVSRADGYELAAVSGEEGLLVRADLFH